jgi:cyclophilin family peptidyl-prolyl cis-trans isomerase
MFGVFGIRACLIHIFHYFFFLFPLFNHQNDVKQKLDNINNFFHFFKLPEWQGKAIGCGGIETKPPVADCGTRIVVRLFWDVAPLACENFATLCSNGSNTLQQPQQLGTSSSSANSKSTTKPAPIGESGKPLTYRSSTIHRVIPGFILQGGDIVFGNGSGGESIFNGKKFKDERAGLNLKHDALGVLSMGNSGKNSNTSQFFLTLSELGAPQCNGKHVVFGTCVSGTSVLKAAEHYGTSEGTPGVSITITECGIFYPLSTPGAGYWYDQPDPDCFSGKSPIFVVRPRVVLVVPNRAVGHKFQSALCLGESSLTVAVTHVVSLEELHQDVEELHQDEAAAARQVLQLLERFAVDVVIVAPACAAVKTTLPREVPPSWTEALLARRHAVGGARIETDDTDAIIGMDEVVLETKPVEVQAAIRQRSWLVKRTTWQFDGIL